MTPINTQLLLELFFHKLKSETFKGYESDFNDFIEKLIGKVHFVESKMDIRALKAFILREVEVIYDGLLVSTLDESKAISLLETAVIYKTYNVANIAKEYLANITAQTEIHGYKIGDSFKNNKDFIVKRLGAIISNGMEQGQHSLDIKRVINKTKDSHLTHVSQGLINSVVQKARSLERESTYKVIETQIEGYYEFNATLDNRTTKGCAMRDGEKFYTRLSDVPSDYRTPRHFRCRSSLIFIPNNYNPINQRASSNYSKDGRKEGKTVSNISYEEWFAAQPKEVQKRYLGGKSYALYNKGTPFKELFNNNRTFSSEFIFSSLR